ncbi:hypothetical protein HDU79_002861 [Rhizoclosmatium sp. JEL0117]|nr:hypothetical protein HDU79_002861 [Rhizoclosmatium sp. JEL0117]
MTSESDDDLFDLSSKRAKAKPAAASLKKSLSSPASSSSSAPPKQPKSKFGRSSTTLKSRPKRAFSIDDSEEDDVIKEKEVAPVEKKQKHNDSAIVILDDDEKEEEQEKDGERDLLRVRAAEVAEARKQLEAEKKKLKEAQELKRASSVLLSSSPKQSHEPEEPAEDAITLTVYIWSRENPETPSKVKFLVIPSHPFKVIMDAVCAKEGLQSINQMVFKCKNVELLPLSTPKSIIHLGQSTKMKIDAYHKTYYNQIQQAKELELERTLQVLREAEEAEADVGNDPVEMNNPSQGGGDDGEILTIKLRDKAQNVIPMNVKMTTKISSIIKEYAKQTGVDAATVRLVFDNERLEPDSTVQDCDIEDDCQIDVK